MHTPNYDHAPYLDSIIRTDRLRRNVSKAVKILKPIVDRFDGIAFRGASGMIPGSILSHLLRKSIVLVRKDEKRHSRRSVEGDLAISSYIIVDDQISTGATIKEIIKQVNAFALHPPRLYGVLLFGSQCEGVDLEFHPITYYEVKRAYEDAVGPIPAEWENYETV